MRTRSWIATAMVVAGLAAPAGDALAANWPQLGYSARRIGNNPSETVLSASTVGGLQLQWQKSWRCGGDAPPVVAYGRVYVGSTDRVCVFDAATGATVLQIPAGDSTDASPAVATIGGKRRLFVSSLDGALYSFAANTGRLLWKVQTGGPLHSSPAVDGGRVYVGSEDGRLYAIDGVTGGVVWSQSVFGPVYGSAAVGFGAVYVIVGDHLWAFETSTGAERFGANYSVYGVAGDNAGTPAVVTDSHYASGGVVFFTTGAPLDPWLVKADPLTGAIDGCAQYLEATSPRRATLTVAHGIVYFQAQGWLYARNASYCSSRVTGGPSLGTSDAWLTGSASFTAPAFANQLVYSGRTAFAPILGAGAQALWSAGDARSPSVVADGRVYAVVGGKVAAYGLPPAS